MDLQQEYKNEKGKNHLSFESGFFPSGTYSNEYVFWLVEKIKEQSKQNDAQLDILKRVRNLSNQGHIQIGVLLMEDIDNVLIKE